MCGIAGIYSFAESAAPVKESELLSIRDQMVSRGPDGAGLWIANHGRIGLAHRRLAIIDLSEGGAQPMSTADGRLSIVFNGEIYNYQALRRQLEQKGYRFRSSSDTEVLLHAYDHFGESMVERLRGMFAFAIWRERDRSLFLARDPFGIKPLYYASDGKCLRFASQVKALLKGDGLDTTPEPAGHVGFLLWGNVPDPFTLYRGIRALPAGASMRVEATGLGLVRQYFNVREEIVRAQDVADQTRPVDTRDALHEALLDSVRHHLIADVPVGVFLSAGIDSTAILALARESGAADLQAITLGFKEYQGTGNDEVPIAARSAEHFGASHSIQWVGRDQFAAEHDRLLEAMDQPSIDGVNSYFVSKAAADSGLKVALSGLGSDELFSGYPGFRQIPLMTRLLGAFGVGSLAGRGFRRVSAPLMKRFTSPKYAGIFEYGGSFAGAYLLRRGLFMPWELSEMMDPDMVREGWQRLETLSCLDQTMNGITYDHLKVCALELSWYMRNQLLRDADWASMAHSLEVRLPFVDVDLFRKLVPLLISPSPPSKSNVANAPSQALPDEVIMRRKTGFSVPVSNWLMADKGQAAPRRGLRGWAVLVHRPPQARNRTVLALVTDAFGGHGGIALYNRDVLTALSNNPSVRRVVAIPRIAPNPLEPLPPRLDYLMNGMGGKVKYLLAVFRFIASCRKVDLVVCGHVNLIPIASVVGLLTRAPILLEIYGIDAWSPPANFLSRLLLHRMDGVVSISDVTKERFLAWSRYPSEKVKLLPNAIHLDRYGMGSKSGTLLDRYGLRNRRVLMTLGRIVSHERYKGFDEVLDLLPRLTRRFPDISYLVVGDGGDLPRLRDKARGLGIEDRVVFTGQVSENEKADHYRLADVFVMPSRGEGFGFVFLEAMACGTPAIGSKLDGGREALRHGELGALVDPNSPTEIELAIEAAFKTEKSVPEGLAYFSFECFESRLAAIVENVIDQSGMRRQP